MAKTLIVGINGSPRKNGRTAGLLKKILQTAKNSGGETKLLHLVDYEIKPCLGCYSTDFKKCIYPCRIKDGMQKIYPLLEKADALVLGSPVYWFNMSGLMKNFIDRLCCAENNGFLYQGKIAALAVSKEDGGEMMALMSMASALNHMGFVLLPYTIYAPGSETGKDWVPETIEFVGKKLVEVANCLKKINWKE